MSNLITKRFVIRKSLIGKNVIISFTNKKGEEMSYSHDEVYNTHKDKFESMNCFEKYKSYTNSNTMPLFCRDLNLSKQYEEPLHYSGQCGVVLDRRIVHHPGDLSFDRSYSVTIACYYITIIS